MRAHFAAIPFLAHLGARLIALSPGRCAMRAPVRPEHAQQHGHVHGGVIATLADSAAGHAALTLLPEGAGTITVEFKLNFVAPARGAALVAEAEVLKPGRTLTVSRVDVFAATGRDRTLAATALVTYLNMPAKD